MCSSNDAVLDNDNTGVLIKKAPKSKHNANFPTIRPAADSGYLRGKDTQLCVMMHQLWFIYCMAERLQTFITTTL